MIGQRASVGILVCIVASAAFALLGFAYTTLIGADRLFGAVAGAVIAMPIAAFEFFVAEGRIGEPLRRLPLGVMMLISIGIWVASTVAGILVLTPIILDQALIPEWLMESYIKDGFVQDTIFCLLVAVLINCSIRIHALIGTRVLLNFLLGRYHRPLREQQVFMFVDILDARGLAHRLGDIRAQSLIAAVFFDIDEVISAFAGETHRYIGDELVVTWPLRRGTGDARCVKCALAIFALLRAHTGRYRSLFAEAPRLRIALHGGPVVVSEIGDDRREIVYFGDTINTTARLRTLAKDVGRELLVSAELLAQMALPNDARAEDMGSFALSGKAQETRVYALHPGEDAGMPVTA